MATELVSTTLRVVVDEGRGGEIVSVARPGGPNVLFHRTWTSPLPAARHGTYGSDVLDWLSGYRGGWQVMFPNAGAPCLVDGVPLPLHGEVSTAPVAARQARADRLTLISGTRRPLRLERTIALDPERPVVRVEERAVNEHDAPLAVLWGHHPAFEASAGASIDLPPGRLVVDADLVGPGADLVPGHEGRWPWARARDGSSVDLSLAPEGPVERVVYLPDRAAGWAAIRDRGRGVGAALAWDVAAFPHLWLWQQVGGARFPFFGRARIVALEPVSSWPSDGLAAAIECGQARWLAGGETAEAWVTLGLFEPTERAVTDVTRYGEVTVEGEERVARLSR